MFLLLVCLQVWLVCVSGHVVRRQAPSKVVEFCKGSKSIIVDIGDQTTGTVKSVNYNVSDYKNNTKCNVVFRTQDKPLVISVFFRAFNVEYQNRTCSYDKLCIYGVRFCGNWTAGQTFDYLVPSNKTFTLNFETDLQISAPGFELTVTAKTYNGSNVSSPASGVGTALDKLKFSLFNTSTLQNYTDKCKEAIDASFSYYMFKSPNATMSPWINVTSATTARPLNTTVSPANTTTVRPSNTTTNVTTVKPLNTTTVAPINTTTAAPINTTAANVTTVKPLNTTTAAPINTTAANVTTVKPLNTTTAAPINTTTAAPINTTTAANVTTVKPLNTTTAAPINTTTAAPINTTAANVTTVKPLNTTTAAPINTTASNVTTVKPLNTTTASPVNTTSTAAPVNATTTTVKPLNTTAALNTTTVVTTTKRPTNTTASAGKKRQILTDNRYLTRGPISRFTPPPQPPPRPYTNRFNPDTFPTRRIYPYTLPTNRYTLPTNRFNPYTLPANR